jgi:hypothetical protein
MMMLINVMKILRRLVTGPVLAEDATRSNGAVRANKSKK